MLEFQKKKKIKGMIYSKLALALILIVLFLFAKATFGFYQKAVESRERKERAEEEMRELEQRKAALEGKIQRLDSPIGVEEELRDRYDLVKEGEQTILIGGTNNDGTTSDTTTE